MTFSIEVLEKSLNPETFKIWSFRKNLKATLKILSLNCAESLTEMCFNGELDLGTEKQSIVKDLHLKPKNKTGLGQFQGLSAGVILRVKLMNDFAWNGIGGVKIVKYSVGLEY